MKTSAFFLACLLSFLLPVPAVHADRGIDFDGVNIKQVQVPNFHQLGVTSEVTIEFWARNDAGGTRSVFILDPDNGANRCQAHLYYSDLKTYWDFGDIATTGRLSVTTPALGAIPHHWAFVASDSGNYMRIYLDGNQIANVGMSDQFSVATAASMLIGGNASTLFDGMVDEFRVWNVARTQTEIQAHKGLYLTGLEPGLRLYYRFTDIAGGTTPNAALATGAAFEGTLIGSPASVTGPVDEFLVTNTNNSGAGSLREMLLSAKANTGPGVVRFSQGLSGSTITLLSEIVITDTEGVIVDASTLADGIIIHGGTGTNRIFSIDGGCRLMLRGLTLTGGNGTGASDSGLGGAILNLGTLTADRCTIHGNTAATSGGGIHSAGPLLLAQCTVTGNDGDNGGGIYSESTARLIHTTVALNTGSLSGRGIYNTNVLTLENSAVGGSIQNNNTVTRVGANMTNVAVAGTVNGSGTLTVETLTFSALADNGGRTQTVQPVTGSPLQNAAVGSFIARDQREIAIVGTADIGAVEVNRAPTISAVADRNTPEDVGTGAIAFTIGDVDEAASALTLTRTSSNPTLVPTANVVFGGSDESRTVTVTPALNLSGTATITLTVSDGEFSASETFILTVTAVNDPPAATNTSLAESYTEDVTFNFTNIVVTEVEGEAVTATLTMLNLAAGTLTTTTASGATSTFSNGVWTAQGSVTQVNALLSAVSFVPAPESVVVFTIAVSITDGTNTVNANKRMTGVAVNDPPTLTDIPNQPKILPNAPEQVVGFAGVGDGSVAENDRLAVTATSDNPALIPDPTVSYTSPGTTGSLRYTPVANAFGSATITVTVSDGGATEATVSQSFTVTVNSPPTATFMNAAQTYTEDADLGLSNIAASDVDDTHLTATLTLSTAAAGMLTTGTSGSVTSTFADRVWTASGPKASVNALLAAVVFQPADNYFSDFTIATSVSDATETITGSKAMTGTGVNDPPTFNDLPDLTLIEDGFARAVIISGNLMGVANEGQTISVTVTSSHGSLDIWSVTGSGNSQRTLGIVPDASLSGTATVTVNVSDGIATTTKTFDVVVLPRNDEPSFTLTSDFSMYATGAAQTRDGVATSISDNDATSVQALTFSLVVDQPGLFSVLPSMNAAGQLSFTALPGAAGRVKIDVTLTDDGGTENGGDDTSSKQTIYIALISGTTALVVQNTSDSGVGSLRDMVALAAARPGPDTITFASSLGASITLSSQITVTDTDLTIDASNRPTGMAVVQSTTPGSAIWRFFEVPAATPSSHLRLVALTLTGGKQSNGGAILCTNGALTATRCTFNGNEAFNDGGAIYATDSTLSLSLCTFSGNTASLKGGAVYSARTFLTPTLTMSHCTVSGNQATNTSSGDGGGIYTSNTSCTISNSIVYGNAANGTSSAYRDDVKVSTSTVTLLGKNFIGSHNFSSVPPGALITSDPLLLTLAGNGGPTKTLALTWGSPARDAAVGSTITTDQRGYVISGTPDIGAYELSPGPGYDLWSLTALPAAATTAERARTADFDGDGQNNETEYFFLTDPNSPTSRPAPTVETGPGTLTIRLTTATGRTYRMKASPNLTSWADAGLPPVVGDGTEKSWTLPTTSQRSFFRVEAVPEWIEPPPG